MIINSLKWSHILSQSASFLKISWGGMPPDPPRKLVLRTAQGVLRTPTELLPPYDHAIL